jgi:catechol 2,3-dioxygenase-like lactoylglutathione lyase family enzyme
MTGQAGARSGFSLMLRQASPRQNGCATIRLSTAIQETTVNATQPASAALQYNRATQDIGNIVEFGHVNLRVPDQQQAIIFYVMGLGLTRDPYLRTGIDNAWMNIGCCQFHLPTGPAQVLRGVTGLVMPSLEALMARLASVQPLLVGTKFAFNRNDAGVEVTCPWGSRVRVHAPDAARFGAMTLGMPYVEIDAKPGSIEGIARFYTDVLNAVACTGEDAAGRFAHITAGPAQSLIYRETNRELPPYDGHHVQIAVADFSGVHGRLLERGLITEESNASQYRFQDITDLSTGNVLATLEHEVRSMRHPLFARALVNRNADVSM